MCTSIPVDQPSFPSERGSVDAPIAAPGQVIEITLNPACPGETGKFGTNPSVLLSFVTPTGTIDRTAVSQVVDDTNLKIVIPDTVDAAAGFPAGLAGPARITVTASGVTVARVLELYEPTAGCDHKTGTVFGNFTVLPKPNEISTATQLLATLDGGGNLLIPLDHSKVVPVSATEALAAFETGKGFFKTFQGSGKAAWEAVADAIAAGGSPADFVEVYSIRGQRLPALALFDRKGSLFGTADAALSAHPETASVLRFPQVTSNGTTLYKLSPTPGQPIVFGNQPSKRDVEIATCPQTIQLTSLRVSPGVIAYTRADTVPKGVVQIHDAATGGQDCGKSTQLVAASATGASIARPYLEAGERLVTFVEQTSSGAAPHLRVFTTKGTQHINAALASPLLKSLLNDRTLAPSLNYVFFSQTVASQDTLGVFAAPAQFPSKAQTALMKGVVSNGEAAVITSSNGVQLYNAIDDQSTSLATAAAGGLAISPALLAFTSPAAASPSTGPGALMVQSVPIPPALPTPQAVAVNAAVAAAVDMTVVFITSESAESANGPGCMLTSPSGACDLNGDGDAQDHVLRVYYAGAAVPSETRLPAVDFVVQGRYVAFRSPESEQNTLDALCGTTPDGKCDRNGDQDANDNVMLVHDLATATTFSTGQAASRCDALCTQLGLEWMQPYGIRGEHLFFLTNELDQNQDLNGDGAITNIDVLRIFDLPSKAIWNVGTLSPAAGPAVLPVMQELPGGDPFLRIVQQSNPKALGSFVLGDADGDGTFDAFDSCVQKANPQQVDDDCDGLGDRLCDPTYCTDFIPRLEAQKQKDVRVTPAVAKAALQYLGRRAVATRECLDRFAELRTGTFSRDATLVCRGYFVNGVEVFPLDRDTNVVVRQAAFELSQVVLTPPLQKGRKALRSSEGVSEGDALLRQLVAAYGEATNAATRVVYGRGPSDLSAAARECQRRLGETSVEYLARAVAAMQSCVQRAESATDLAAHCIGSVRDQQIVLPEDRKVHQVLEAGAERLRKVATDPACTASLAYLDACSSDSSAARCIACVNWRRAADAVLTLSGASGPQATACRRPRPAIKAPPGAKLAAPRQAAE